MEIRQEDPGSPAIADLLARHVQEASANTPTRNAHVLDADRLRTLDLSFWAAWDAETLLGFVALKELTPRHGELNRCAPRRSRCGVASDARCSTT